MNPNTSNHCNRSMAIVCTHQNIAVAIVPLSTGGHVIERPMCNGATDIALASGENMSEAQWEDYCAIVRSGPVRIDENPAASFFPTDPIP